MAFTYHRPVCAISGLVLHSLGLLMILPVVLEWHRGCGRSRSTETPSRNVSFMGQYCCSRLMVAKAKRKRAQPTVSVHGRLAQQIMKKPASKKSNLCTKNHRTSSPCVLKLLLTGDRPMQLKGKASCSLNSSQRFWLILCSALFCS
jgi:hypothetical protein